MDSSNLDAHLIMVYWTHKSQPQNGISIGSAVFAQYIRATNTHRQTHRHTNYATCGICCNRPHLCYACEAAL